MNGLPVRLAGYLVLAIGVALHPLNGALIVIGAAAVLEGFALGVEPSLPPDEH